ncbi:MAG: hypothetical protein NT062_10710 [Proteobacteria bacterium]|nr:hypothetical protein [Pseudomonadota bacterium]
MAIPVYISNHATGGLQLLKKTATTNWTLTELAFQVRMGIAEFNNNIGVPARLYYSGQLNSLTVSSGIIITSNATLDQAAAHGYPGTPSCTAPTRGMMVNGGIQAQRYDENGIERIWVASPDIGGNDLFILMTHELGHVLGMPHSRENSGAQLQFLDSGGHSYVSSPYILMHWSGPVNIRHWTRYEKDTLRSVYGTRQGVDYHYQTGPGRSYGASFKAFTTQPSSSIILGPGKSSENGPKQFYSWVEPTQTALGTGRTWNSFASFGTLFEITGTAPAVGFGGGEVRAYWLERDPPQTLPDLHLANYAGNFVYKQLRWMKSTNGGASFSIQGGLTDPSGGFPLTTWTDNVSVAYDPFRSVFLVVWLDLQHTVNILTMPAPGSAQVGNVRTVLPLTQRFWETPTISCDGAGTCGMVGIPADMAPYLTTLWGTIGTSGSWTTLGTEWHGGFPMIETATITYQSVPKTWLLGYLALGDDKVFTQTRTTGSAWTVPSSPLYTSTKALSAPSSGSFQCAGCVMHSVVEFNEYGP